jgi:hypothetical protein
MTCGFCGSFRDDATRIVILRHGGVGRAEGFFIGECAAESGRSKQRPYAMNHGSCEVPLTQYDPETERALRIAAKAAKKYRKALRTLAKSSRS